MKTTPRMLETIGRTRPWVLLVSLFGFAVALGLMAGAGFFTVAGIELLRNQSAAGGFFVLAGAFVLNAMMVTYPSAKLWGFASACRQFTVTRQSSALAMGLMQHRKFWRYWGILTLVSLVLNLVLTVIALLTGMAAALQNGPAG